MQWFFVSLLMTTKFGYLNVNMLENMAVYEIDQTCLQLHIHMQKSKKRKKAVLFPST